MHIHISGTAQLSALIEVMVYLTAIFFSDRGWLSMARPESSVLCLKARWTLWSAASGPVQAYRGADSNQYPREELQ